jgi:glycosyltransferase involved in cell wall biosynthesis
VGWGRHAFLDAPPPFLHRHGYLSDAALRDLVGSCHLLLSTSKAEGLGLPLLEVQHGGLPVVAPDDPVFREVLGASGLFIRPEDPNSAAAMLAAAITNGRLARAAQASRGNVARWNAAAAGDGRRFDRFLAGDPTAYSGAEAGLAPDAEM